MESRKSLIVLFFVVTAVFFNVCRALNDNSLYNLDEKQCVCDWNAGTTTVPDKLFNYKISTDIRNNYYQRQIIFFYYDLLEDVIKIHIPNRHKQKLIPDVPIENNDVLITLSNETVNDLFRNNPEHVTLEKHKLWPEKVELEEIIRVPEKDISKIKPKIPNKFNSDLHTTVEYFQPSNPTDFNHRVPINFREELLTESSKNILHPNSGYIQTVYTGEEEHVSPINFSEDFWPGSHTNMPHPHANDIKPVDSGEQDHVLPITFSKEIWPESHVSVPHAYTLHPSDIKLDYSGIKNTGQSVQIPYLVKIPLNKPMTNLYKPGDPGMMLRPGYSQLQQPCDGCEPTKYYKLQIRPYIIRNQYSKPGHAAMVPHPPSDIKLVDFSKRYPAVPINFKEDFWPSSQVSVKHPSQLYQSDIKFVYYDEKEVGNSKDVPNSHLLNPTDIKPVGSGEQVPNYSEEVSDSNPGDIKPMNSGEQELEYSEEVANSNSLRVSTIKPVDSDKQESDHSKEMPNSYSIHLENIKPIDSVEEEPNYSEEASISNLLHPDDIKLIDSGDKEPGHSEEIPYLRPLNPSDIKPINYGEEEPGQSKEIPYYLHPFHPNDINPIPSDEQKANYSEEVPPSQPHHPGDIKPIIPEPEYSEEEANSHSLYPDDIKPIDTGKKEPGHSEEVPYLHPLSPSDVKPISYDKEEPGQSKEIPYYLHPFHPNDINPIPSDELKANYSDEVPPSQPHHPGDIKPIIPEPEYSEEEANSHSLYPDDIKPIDTGKKEPGHSEEVPYLHPLSPSDIKPIDSGEEKPIHSEEVPYLHPLYPSDLNPIPSGEREASYSGDVSHSQPLHPSDINPIPSGELVASYSEEVPPSQPLHPSDINAVISGKHKPSYSGEILHSDPFNSSDIITVDFGEQLPVQVPYPVEIQQDEKNIEFDKHLPGNLVKVPRLKYSQFQKHLKTPPDVIQTGFSGRFKWPLTFTEKDRQNFHYKIPLIDYKQRKKPLSYMGYKTFHEWFREEMRKFKNIDKKINVYSVGHDILKILNENGMFVSEGGVLKDLRGRILSLHNLKLRPILIGDSMSLDNLFEKDSNIRTKQYYPNKAVSTWSEFVLLTMLYPPKTLGVIPLGTTFLPSSLPVHSLSSIFKPRNGPSVLTSKRHHKRQSPNYLLPDRHYKQYRYSSPVKITEPANPKIKQNLNRNTHVSENDAVKDGKSYDESIENFLRNIPHYSYSRKRYINRKDLSDNDKFKLNNVESSNTPLKKYGPEHKHPLGLIHNDNNNKLIRIIRGIATTDSGRALNNKGKSRDQLKPKNHNSHNLGSHHCSQSHKKHDYNYMDREEFYHDDLLIRIIGGNAATGSGYPLSNKGRSGRPY